MEQQIKLKIFFGGKEMEDYFYQLRIIKITNYEYAIS